MSALMTQLFSLIIMLGLFCVAEILSKLTKGKIPAALIMALSYIIGFWTFMPADIVKNGGLDTLFSVFSLFVVINMACGIPVQEMKRQWKTIIIGFLCVVGITVFMFTIGVLITDRLTVYSTAAEFAGGSGALLVLVDVAKKLNNTEISTMALISGTCQIIIGYPLTGVALRKESQRLLGMYQEGKLQKLGSLEDMEKNGWKPFTRFNSRFGSTTMILFKLVLISFVSTWLQDLTGGNVNRLVWALVLGFFACVTGFLEPNCLSKANSNGICMTFMLAYLFGLYSAVTPEFFFSKFLAIMILAVVSTAGIFAVAWLMSKVFGKKDDQYSLPMCFGIGLTCYHGFPVNVMLTQEAIDSTVDDPEAKDTIKSVMMPKMLVGGFTTVTFTSVILATICGVLLTKMLG